MGWNHLLHPAWNKCYLLRISFWQHVSRESHGVRQSQRAAGALYCWVLPTLQLTERNSCEKDPCKHTPTALHITVHTMDLTQELPEMCLAWSKSSMAWGTSSLSRTWPGAGASYGGCAQSTCVGTCLAQGQDNNIIHFTEYTVTTSVDHTKCGGAVASLEGREDLKSDLERL